MKRKDMLTEEGLWLRAEELFPEADQHGTPSLSCASMRKKWVAAVLYLRSSKRGWTLDKMAAHNPQRNVLHGYTASMPPLETHVSLPDEVVIPGPWHSKK